MNEGKTPKLELSISDKLKRLLQELRVAEDVPLPDLAQAPKLDAVTTQAWLDDEADLELRAIKLKLTNSIEHISFDHFLEALQSAQPDIKSALGNKPYAVMFGGKPHSSQRWVYELMKGVLPPPALRTYFNGNYTPAEKKRFNELKDYSYGEVPVMADVTDVHTLKAAIETSGVETFLFMDDVSYTGKQMIEAVRRFAFVLRNMQLDFIPTLVIYVPISTDRLKNSLVDNPRKLPYSEVAKAVQGVNIKVINPIHPLRQVGEILTQEECDNLDTKRHGRLNSYDEKRFPMDACLAYVDHKVPDHWSFPNPIAVPTGLDKYHHAGRKTIDSLVPYKRTNVAYFSKEQAEFQQYSETFIKSK